MPRRLTSSEVLPVPAGPMLSRLRGLTKSAPGGGSGYVPSGPGGVLTEGWYFLEGGDADVNYVSLDPLDETTIDGGELADATTPAMDHIAETLTADGGAL